MSNRRERIDKLMAELEAIAGFDERNQATGLERALQIWEENLPDGLTRQQVASLQEYRKDYSCAFNSVYSRKALDLALSDDDIAFLTAELETDDVIFGFGFARPVINTPENLIGGISHEVSVNLHDFTAHNDKLAELWMEALSEAAEVEDEILDA